MPKSKLSRDQWLALVAEYAQSGLNVAEFCAAKDVAAQSFYQWKRKAEGRWPSAKAEPQDASDASGKLPTFVPLRVAGGLERVEVELPGASVSALSATHHLSVTSLVPRLCESLLACGRGGRGLERCRAVLCDV